MEPAQRPELLADWGSDETWEGASNELPPDDLSSDGGGQVIGSREKWQPDELRHERADRRFSRRKH